MSAGAVVIEVGKLAPSHTNSGDNCNLSNDGAHWDRCSGQIATNMGKDESGMRSQVLIVLCIDWCESVDS